MKKKIIVISALVTIVISSCYYDSEDMLYPETSACDTTAVTYSATIVPLFQSYGCASCHSGGAPSGNISLDEYSSVKVVALNGRLYGAISHNAAYSPMPQGGNKMNACSINKIKAWIDAGAPDN